MVLTRFGKKISPLARRSSGPSSRSVSGDSEKRAEGTAKVAWVIMGPMALGRMCRKIRVRSGAPKKVLTNSPHLTLFPALVVSALMLAFNMFGNGLRGSYRSNL